ncbi:TBC1 domain family member 30-like isoform X1 [Hypanus sabinus]|uniref:TBC1 domain family member 30-like isoform X1 n=1 Tax=Hypanus sabinus TaxID=79690 RepID=UPI0028C46C68|nr:TBC1 domain family member 30-like isoform X1 [Hypanus sabinus]
MSRVRSPAVDQLSAGGSTRARNRSLGDVLSDVLYKRTCISRSAPRLRCSLEQGADPRLTKSTERVTDQDGFQQAVYSMATFPFPKVKDPREKCNLQLKLAPSSCHPDESSERRNSSSGCSNHCTVIVSDSYLQAQNPQNWHPAAQSENQSACDVVWSMAGDSVPQRESDSAQTVGPVVKQQESKMARRQQQSQQLTPKHDSSVPRSPGMPFCSSKSRGINHFLRDQKLRNSSRSKNNQVHHTPSPRTTQAGQKERRNKLAVPWCSQRKMCRKGLVRKSKARSGCSDTVGLLEEQTDGSKAESSKGDHCIHEEGRNTPGICWEQNGKFGEQLTGFLFDADSLSGVESLLKALRMVEQHQHLTSTRPTPKPNNLEFSTEKDFAAFPDLKENPINTSLPGYLCCKSLGENNSGICRNVTKAKHPKEFEKECC